ncbi:MAG: hypothetical protein AB7G23_15750 [Vicinamibacterales bacterium]
MRLHLFSRSSHRPARRHALAALLTVLLPASLLLGACAGPLEVATIQVGRSINSDGSVADHTTRFTPRDTVHVSVLTTAAGSGDITVRWMRGGSVLSEATKAVSYRGAAATEFRLQSTAGFPLGDYSVEIIVDGTSIGTRNFRVVPS